MSDDYTNKPTETDWEAFDALRDDEIDFSDIPPLTDEFFEKAQLFIPRTEVMLDVDSDVVKWFQQRGEGWKKQMNAALRIYALVHRRAEKAATMGKADREGKSAA